MKITKRLSVEGPDIEGDYEVTVVGDGEHAYCFLTRAEADALIAALNPWRDIASAPKDGKIDILAKMWAPAFDTFVHQRFADCFWLGPDTMTNRDGQWVGVDKYWRPTHWMPRPAIPADSKE